MDVVIQAIMEATGAKTEMLAWAFLIVGALIAVMAVVSIVVSIMLSIKYVKYNRKKNSIGATGEQVARKILDANDLKHIRVSPVGSIMFGNSYSHYFKKVRLRRFTYKKDSISSLAMAAQKSSLAVLDKENDPDMKKRNKLIPFITFGPFFFIPLIVVGVIIDLIIKTAFPQGMFTLIFASVGVVFYLCSFIFSLVVLKVEKKGQEKAYQILRENKLATEAELKDIKSLFKLYNIQYVNDIILSFLELVYRVLQIIAAVQSSDLSSSN